MGVALCVVSELEHSEKDLSACRLVQQGEPGAQMQ